jgi:hypothetical protein
MPQLKMLICAGCVFALGVAEASLAATVTIAWNSNSDSNIAGYVILYGTESGAYTHFLDVGNQTSQEIPGLADGTTYYFVVRAYDTTFLYGDPSEEISAQTASATIQPPPPPLTCPVPVVSSPDGNPVRVEYPHPAVSAGFAPLVIDCVPSPGSIFPVGVTPVTCTATDPLQQTGSCSTSVIVMPPRADGF